MYRSGDVHERHLPGRPLTSQEKAVVATFCVLFVLLMGGLVALVVVETQNNTECGGAITNTPNAPRPQPPPGESRVQTSRVGTAQYN